MKLYGTTTSPFVRRVRIVAAEIDHPIELVDTAPPLGQAVLRDLSPIRKVPVAVLPDGKPLFDSLAIIDHLDPSYRRRASSNLVNAIDAALDAVIQLFYLRRDGVAVDGSPYATRQLERADAIFAWLATQHLSTTTPGLAEISLCCALDWMDFRGSYPTERAAALARVRTAFHERPSFVATRPQP